jgi:hypothetical protein
MVANMQVDLMMGKGRLQLAVQLSRLHVVARESLTLLGLCMVMTSNHFLLRPQLSLFR